MSILNSSLSVNIATNVIEQMANKLDIKLTDNHKRILNILISTLVFQDGMIIISSQAINEINRIIKKKNDKVNFVNILLGYNCIQSIDKYGAITIPLAFFLNKCTIKREVVSNTKEKYLNKKVLTNATQTLCICNMLNSLGIPNYICIPIVNILLELAYTNIKEEEKLMLTSNVGFKGYKMSEIKRVLHEMQIEKILLSTMILFVVSEIGFKMYGSIILINVLSELFEVLRIEFKKSKKYSFLS